MHNILGVNSFWVTLARSQNLNYIHDDHGSSARWTGADERKKKNKIWTIALEWPSTFALFFSLLVAVAFSRLKSKTFHFSFALNDPQTFILFPLFFCKTSARSFSHVHSFFIEFQNMAFIWDNMMIPINIGQNGFFAPCIIAMSIYYTNTQPRAMCAFYEPFLWWTRYSSKNSFDPNHSNWAKWPFSISLFACVSLQKNNGNNVCEWETKQKQPTKGKKSV